MPLRTSFTLFSSLSDNTIVTHSILGAVGWVIIIGLAVYFFKVKDYRK
jgi:hypothetical protein